MFGLGKLFGKKEEVSVEPERKNIRTKFYPIKLVNSFSSMRSDGLNVIYDIDGSNEYCRVIFATDNERSVDLDHLYFVNGMSRVKVKEWDEVENGEDVTYHTVEEVYISNRYQQHRP